MYVEVAHSSYLEVYCKLLFQMTKMRSKWLMLFNKEKSVFKKTEIKIAVKKDEESTKGGHQATKTAEKLSNIAEIEPKATNWSRSKRKPRKNTARVASGKRLSKVNKRTEYLILL